MALLNRRGLLRVGAMALLSGCNLTDRKGTQQLLRTVSHVNDRAQAALFRADVRAPLFPDSALTQPFRFNAFYTEASVPEIDVATWQLRVGGEAHADGRLVAAQGAQEHPGSGGRGPREGMPGRHDAGIARAGLEAEAILLLEDRDLVPGPRQEVGGGHAHHASAQHERLHAGYFE